MKHYCPNMIRRGYERIREDFGIWAGGIALIIVIAEIFFDHIAAAAFLSPYLILWYREQREKREKKKRQRFKQEGKDFFQSFMNCLEAGYSLEESIPVIIEEMSMLYADRQSMILSELVVMERKLQMNQAFDTIFYEFARKSRNEDFIQFSFVLKTAKKRGGNLIRILEETIRTIHQKNQVEHEIETILSGRVFEKNIMQMIPMFLICYLKIFSPSYLEIMYDTLAGRVCMGISLIIMYAAGRLADRIVEIEV